MIHPSLLRQLYNMRMNRRMQHGFGTLNGMSMGSPGCLLQIVEQKGLDIVRRDWCALSKDVGNYALARILSGVPREEVVDAIHTQLHEVCICVGSSLILVICMS